jgi:hypothetical protein
MDKKAQGFHSWGTTDLFIIIFGVIIGIALVYFGLTRGFIPSDFFCAVPAA